MSQSAAAASQPAGLSQPVRPADVIPHREPFLFVDEITSLTPGERASGLWHLTGDEPFFTGHFPGRPTLPGVLMCEAMAQLGAAAVLSDSRYEGRLPLFGGLDKAGSDVRSAPATLSHCT